MTYDLRPLPLPSAAKCAAGDAIGVLVRPALLAPLVQQMLRPSGGYDGALWWAVHGPFGLSGWLFDKVQTHMDPAYLGWFWLTDPAPLAWVEGHDPDGRPTWTAGDLEISEYVLHVGGSEYEACWALAGMGRFDSLDEAKRAAAVLERDRRTGALPAEQPSDG